MAKFDPNEPQLVTKNVLGEDMSYDIELSLDDLISNLQRDRARFTKEGWSDLYLDLDEERYSDRRYAYLKGKRLETTEEIASRLVLMEETDQRRVQREKAEFARLSALYGGSK